jgi:LTXXQ motif family protein
LYKVTAQVVDQEGSMSKLSAFTAAVLCLAAAALAGAPVALAKSGGGGHGGGHGGKHGGHGFHGGKIGHGKIGHHGGGHRVHVRGGGHRGTIHGFHRAKPHFHAKRHFHRGKQHFAGPGKFARHGHRHAFVARAPRHFSHRGFRATATHRWGVPTGLAVHAPWVRRGLAAPVVRPGFHAGLAARFHARPAFRLAAWPGPFFWSWAGDDVFWPTAYDDVFWTYGTPDILAGVFAPQVYARAYAPARRGHRTERAVARGGEAPSAELCRDQPAELADIAGVEQEVRPTAEQGPLFDALYASEKRAVEILRNACPSHIPTTPTGRLAAMAQWFDGMLTAVRIVRPSLETFFGALTDEQKARFLVTTTRDAASRWLAQCRSAPRAWASVPTEGLARELDLAGTQLAALDELSLASDQAVQAVRGSCPSEIPLTPTGRLAAIEARLAALNRAVETLRPALDRFYAALSDEQKARFNTLGARGSRRAG